MPWLGRSERAEYSERRNMPDLRKTAVWCIALLLVVWAGDRLAARLLGQILRRSHFRFSEIERGGVDADIVVLGDSRGVTSFNAPAADKILHRRTFSVCYNGMATRIAEALLADYLDPNRPPRLVVIEVTSAVESMKLSPELRTYASLSPRLAALYAEQHPLSAKVGRLFNLLNYNSELYLRALYYLRRSDQDWANWSTMSPQEVARVRSVGPWTLEATQENLDALERMVRVLRSRNVEVRLLVGPYLPEYVAHLQQFDHFTGAISERARRVDPALRIW